MGKLFLKKVENVKYLNGLLTMTWQLPLISRNADEEEEAYAAFDPDANPTGNQIVQDIEDRLDSVSLEDLASVSALSEKFVSDFKEFTDTPCERLELPLACAEAAIEARDVTKTKKFSIVLEIGSSLPQYHQVSAHIERLTILLRGFPHDNS